MIQTPSCCGWICRASAPNHFTIYTQHVRYSNIRQRRPTKRVSTRARGFHLWRLWSHCFHNGPFLTHSSDSTSPCIAKTMPRAILTFRSRSVKLHLTILGVPAALWWTKSLMRHIIRKSPTVHVTKPCVVTQYKPTPSFLPCPRFYFRHTIQSRLLRDHGYDR
jgi:hypothetical protein